MAREKELDLFDIIGVSPNASAQDIADAFNNLVKENQDNSIRNLSVEEQLAREAKIKEATKAYKVLSDPTKRGAYYKEYLARRSAEAGNPRVSERKLRAETMRPSSGGSSTPTSQGPSQNTPSGTRGVSIPTRAPRVPNFIANRVPVLGKLNNFVNSTVGKIGGTVSNALKPLTSAAGKLLAPLLAKIGPMLARLIGALTTGPVGAVIAAASLLGSYGKDIAKVIVGLGLAMAGTSISAAASATATTAAIAIAILGLTIPLIMFIINSGAYVVPPSSIPITPEDSPITGCSASNLPQPVVPESSIRRSADGKYAYPLAPFNEMYYGCIHWDGELSTDMGITGVKSGGYRPVLAYTTGVIDSAYIDAIGGNAIVLAGDDGRYYYYAHNCALYVDEGQRVTVGEVIATSDTTGSAGTTSDPVEHVHFAIGTDSRFEGGGGEVCPSWDFEQKFRLGRCLLSTQNQCRVPPPTVPAT